MAQRMVIQFIDDLDGTTIKDGQGETVRFALDNTEYEIDLTRANAGKLRDVLAEYVGAARKVSGGRGRRGGGRQARDYEIAAVRAWARSRGIDVADRGRIPQSVVDQFRAAGN